MMRISERRSRPAASRRVRAAAVTALFGVAFLAPLALAGCGEKAAEEGAAAGASPAAPQPGVSTGQATLATGKDGAPP